METHRPSTAFDENRLPASARSLLDQMRKQYPLKIGAWPLAGRSFLLATVDCVDDLLDELVTLDPRDVRVSDERLPYWAEVWPSSLALAEHITQHADRVNGRSVLELGCGQGLAGVAAMRCGGKVTFTDYAEDALRIARLNTLLNGGEEPETRLMDWRDPHHDLRAHLILAADVVYERRFFTPLIRTFETALQPGGAIWLAEPQRPLASAFFDELRERGFEVCSHTRQVERTDEPVSIDLHVITGP